MKRIQDLGARFCVMNEAFFEKQTMPKERTIDLTLLRQHILNLARFTEEKAKKLALISELYLALPVDLYEEMETDISFKRIVGIHTILTYSL